MFARLFNDQLSERSPTRQVIDLMFQTCHGNDCKASMFSVTRQIRLPRNAEHSCRIKCDCYIVQEE